MPKTADFSDRDGEDGKILEDVGGVIGNSYTEEELKGFIAEYEAEQGKIDAIMQEAQVKCQPFVDQMKEIAKAAAERGIEKKAFKAKITQRAYQAKAERVREKLSQRQQEVFDDISAKLGDLPLFERLDG